MARLQHEGAEAVFGADHLGRHHQDESDGRRDPEAGDDGGHGAGQDHLADDVARRQVEGLGHADQIARDAVDAAVAVDHRREEDAQRNGGQLGGLADAEPEDEERQQGDLGDRKIAETRGIPTERARVKRPMAVPRARPAAVPMAQPPRMRPREAVKWRQSSPLAATS